MEELLKHMIGKTIDLAAGGQFAYRGEIVDVRGGILLLKGEDDRTMYVAIDKITAFSESLPAVTRPGFIA